MDRATDLTDAFVEIKFSDYEIHKTQTQRRSLNPVWNEDFRFEVSDDSDLQNEALELKVMDYDNITYHDSIGTVFIDLNPLLTWDTNAQISGWFPIYDTLLGTRGELNAQVKLQFFGDVNPFKDSSAGVQFFTLNSIPSTHRLVAVLGFVSAIDNEDDPEYHWSDNFRTPRTSNEARTRVMFSLSGHIRRQLGKKVLELNGNAVLGFKQYFDLEYEQKAITARAIGTAVRLIPLNQDNSSSEYNTLWGNASLNASMNQSSSLNREVLPLSPSLNGSLAKYSKSPGMDPPPLKVISESPTSSSREILGLNFMGNNFKSNDVTLMTLNCFPNGSIIGTGGLVSAVSIKLLDNDERAVREAWWAELREEIKSHAKALYCPVVIGYTETTSIEEELAVLHCSGTAVWIDFSKLVGIQLDVHRTSSSDIETEAIPIKIQQGLDLEALQEETFSRETGRKMSHMTVESEEKRPRLKRMKSYPHCQACHITYPRQDSPFPMAMTRCLVCKKNYVPEILLTTMEPPRELKIVGQGRLIEAHVCRQKKVRIGETRAIHVSESIPFCQYDIHRQLTHKLRIYGLNAVFGLKIQINIGESLMTAVATGTAVFVRALSAPPAFKVFRNLDVLDEEDQELLNIQKRLMQQSENNRKMISSALTEMKASETLEEEMVDGHPNAINNEESDSDDDNASESENEASTKKNLRSSVVVQIDDEHDEDLVLLMDAEFFPGFTLCNTEVPLFFNESNASNIQMITVVKQGNINMITHHPNRQLADIFKTLYQDLQSQVAYFHPSCTVTGINYDIYLPKDNFVQISLTAVAMGELPIKEEEDIVNVEVLAPLATRPGFFQNFLRSDTSAFDFSNMRQITKASLTDTFATSMVSMYDDLEVFQIEDDDVDEQDNDMDVHVPTSGSQVSLNVLQSKKQVHVEVTPLSFLPQANLKQFLGRISLHFVKEATVIYETGTGKEGMGGFTHVFFCEVFAIVKAHAFALGGNAVLGFHLDQVTVMESIRNQAYALVSISGDVFSVEYDANSMQSQTTFASRLFGGTKLN